MPNPLITLSQVSKIYQLRSSKPTLSERLLAPSPPSSVTALNHINLNVNSGTKLGLIGSNGSGKSTLLQIIAGITTPTHGSVTVRGRVISLIELTAGFHPDLTGMDNVYLNGLILGMTRSQIQKQLSQIIAYSELNNFIHAPLYTYSSGMVLRLGFSVAIHTPFDILLLDENLAVGDAGFKQKAENTLKQLITSTKTLIIASHQLKELPQICQQLVWLDYGSIKASGRPSLVIKQYERQSIPPLKPPRS